MPSDAKKRQAARKKEEAKQRQKKKNSTHGQQPETDIQVLEEAAETVNGTIEQVADDSGHNGLSPELDERRAVLGNGENVCDVTSGFVEDYGNNGESDTNTEDICLKLKNLELANAEARSCTGVLTSHPQSRDLKVSSFSVTFYGREFISDTKLELNSGRRYGLVGLNGSGKSTLLQAVASREVPIPEHIDIFLLSREMPASSKTALEAVIEVDEERLRLETEAEELAGCAEDGECNERLMDIYERLEELDSDTAEVKAAEILHGLGFSHSMMNKKCRSFSGGWRMRIALARALFVKPSLLLLDEPTNHLDLDACVWLEQELKKYKRILVIVSHSQDFLNSVCTNIIHLHKQRLRYYGGNYDAFVRTRIELLENQLKQYNWEQDQLKHMKDYIARFGHGSAKLARQAQSKEKTMSKMVAGGLTEKVIQEKVKQFYFIDPGYVPPPVIMVQHVSFRYGENTPYIFKNLDFGIDLDTRTALVGPNGAGKSTLLKLLVGDVMPSDGLIRRHSHVKIGRYHQHLHEELPLDISALDYMMLSYPEVADPEQMRRIVGRYGLTGRQQTCPMKQLSDGQRCRVSFAWLAWQSPHLLLLDEPTNHLDMESIDALADAINEFEGGMILVSHDFRLVKQVAEEVWVCERQTIRKWEGDIFSYKEYLKNQIEKNKKGRK